VGGTATPPAARRRRHCRRGAGATNDQAMDDLQTRTRAGGLALSCIRINFLLPSVYPPLLKYSQTRVAVYLRAKAPTFPEPYGTTEVVPFPTFPEPCGTTEVVPFPTSRTVRHD